MLPEEQAENSRYLYELASAKFGFQERLLARVQAFHFKGGQGAKTGTGGHLPGAKVKGKIAQVRGLKEGTTAVSLEATVALMAVLSRACGYNRLSQFNLDDLSTYNETLHKLTRIAWAGGEA